jgi:hypothetical protein
MTSVLKRPMIVYQALPAGGLRMATPSGTVEKPERRLGGDMWWYVLVALGVAMLAFIAVFAVLTVMRARRSDGVMDVTSRQSLDSYVDARYHTPADTERYDSRKD